MCANCSFPFPNRFVYGVFRDVIPDLPETLPFRSMGHDLETGTAPVLPEPGTGLRACGFTLEVTDQLSRAFSFPTFLTSTLFSGRR